MQNVSPRTGNFGNDADILALCASLATWEKDRRGTTNAFVPVLKQPALQSPDQYQPEWQQRHKVTLKMPKERIGPVMGPKFVVANDISRRVGGGTRITAVRNPLTPADSGIIVEADTAFALEAAVSAVKARLAQVSQPSRGPGRNNINNINSLSGAPGLTSKHAVGRTALAPERQRHCFIDNSNIYISALSQYEGAGVQNGAVRVNVRALTALLEAERFGVTVGRRFVAGSKPPGSSAIWERYRDLGYHVEVHSRDHETRGETAVDSVTHAAALQLITDLQLRGDPPGTHTIVLATGDGGENNGVTSFPRLAFTAASLGIRVEIWSWAATLNIREFSRVAALFPDGRVTMHHLDPFKSEICFVAMPQSQQPLR